MIKRLLSNATKQRLREVLLSAQYRFLASVLYLPERFFGTFISLHSRPARARDVNISFEKRGPSSDWAIVIQGPIMHERRFTEESIALYQKHFPDALIVLSTWEDEETAAIEAHCSGIKILRNKKPDISGVANINFQLVSSHEGAKAATASGRKYTVKTRTDQRMYSPFALSHMRDLLEQFPAAKAGTMRIGGISANSMMHKPYQFPDLLIFGSAAGVERYFSAPLVKNDAKLSFLDPARPFTVECYLCTKYAESIGYPLQYTHDDFLTLVARQFIIADVYSLDWYWYKRGEHYRRFFADRRGLYSDRHYRVDFADWLALYRSRNTT